MSQQGAAPTESKALNLKDKANKVAEEAMAKQVPVVEMLSNIPSTARAAAGDLKNMVMHPIETAKGVANLAQGAYQKFTPGIQDKEMYVDAIANRMKDRYGGIDKINRTLRKDPAGVALDVVPMASGAKIAKAVAKSPLKVVPQGAINKLYESAAKFSTTKDRTKLVEAALKNKINPSPITKPNIKLKNLSDSMKSRVNELIDEAAKRGNKVHKNIVFRDIGAVKKEVKN